MIDNPNPNLVKLKDEESIKLWRKLANYENLMYRQWLTESLENRAFYFGHQSSHEDIEINKERGQYHIVINKIRKAMKTISGMLSAKVPKYVLESFSSPDDLKAALGNRLLDWVWSNSGGVTTFRRAIKDALVDNIKYLHPVYSRGKVKFVLLSCDEVIVDPNSRDPMFADAEMICIKRWVSVEYVKAAYGVDAISTEIPANYFTSLSTASPEERKVGEEFIQRVFSDDTNWVNIYECYKKTYERDGEGNVRTRIVKETVIGYKDMFRETLPENITEYPIIPIYSEDTENPYKRGEVHFIKDLQKFINKSYGVVLHNAQLMGNPKIFLRETDLPGLDAQEFEDTYARPGSINVLTGNAEAPIIVSGQPISSAFFELYQDAKMELEAATVSQDLQMLSTSESSPSLLLDQREVVLDSLKDLLSIIDLACSQAGKVALQYCSAYMPPEHLARLLDKNNTLDRVKQYGDIDIENEEDIAHFIETLKQKGYHEEEIEHQLAQMKLDFDFVEAVKSYTELPDFNDMDILVVPGSYTPTYETSLMRLMMELANIEAVDPTAILKYVPVENREELIERHDTIRNLSGTIQTLEEENDGLKSALKSLEGKVVTARIDAKTMETQTKLDKLRAEEKVKGLMRKYEHRLQTREEKQEFKNMVTDMMLEFKAEELLLREQEIESKATETIDYL